MDHERDRPYTLYKHFVRHLKTLGQMNHYGVWMSHDLMKINLMDCISIYNSLLKHKSEPFFKMNNHNEKWLAYNNVPKKILEENEMNNY